MHVAHSGHIGVKAIFGLTLLALLGIGPANAQVVNYVDRTTFNAAVNPNVLEAFTPTDHYPIRSGILNSMTNEPSIGIKPGDIQPGVTYRFPVNNSNEDQFNIDAEGGFNGGFLDSLRFRDNPSSPLTITFDSPTTGFGFDTNELMGSSFGVTFHLADGSTVANTLALAPVGGLQFFGFGDNVGIQSATISGNNSLFNFALDNFAFKSAPVPEASTTVSLAILLALGLGSLTVAARCRKATSRPE